MRQNKNITVVIATAFGRTDWLINRSLKSVYTQSGLNPAFCQVLLIDDNREPDEIYRIRAEVLRLREALKVNGFKTEVLKNNRTRFRSGTGAWNTGIHRAYQQWPNGFVAILDDDDKYLPHHLADCIEEVDDNTVAVFQQLYWRNVDSTILSFPFTLADLKPERFFIGNPGIQGSNMFFKTRSLIEIDGFDEKLPNTTDRDLLIRFLWHIDQQENAEIKVLENFGVEHYNHQRPKVNRAGREKDQGLDIFYKKYKPYFSEEAYQKSLLRAQKYFNYLAPECR